MGGLFGVVSQKDCVTDLFYGTDYHSHLGTKRGGLAVLNPEGFTRFIHNIENAQFRSKFELDVLKMKGNKGIGVISDFDVGDMIQIRKTISGIPLAALVLLDAGRIKTVGIIIKNKKLMALMNIDQWKLTMEEK